jgi:hypothetical protein
MENAPAKFDWISWLASIPGIPTGWGEAPIEATAECFVQMGGSAADWSEFDQPERIAA